MEIMGNYELRNKVENFKLFTLLSFVAAFSSLLMLCFAAYYASSDWFAADTMSIATIPLSVALLYSITAIFLGFFQKRAAIEEEDKLLLEKRKERKSTFDSDEDALFTAGRTLKNYSKYAPYVISILSSILIILLLIIFWRIWGNRLETPLPMKPLQAAFIAFLLSAISIFSGVFCIGQSRRKAFRWLRPVGVWLVLASVMLVTASLSVLLIKAELPKWDYYLSRLFMVICVILAAELLINFLIEFYRPRTGTEERPLFESRFLSVVTEPGGVLSNIADTLDYQFGFQVSGTWIYVFLEKSIAPFMLMWLVLLWLFTTVDEVSPGEMGVRETLGAHSDTALDPGFYLKWPWPIQKIRKLPVNRIQEIFVGPELRDEQGKEKRPDVILWTKSHYAKEGRFLIATDELTKNTEKEPGKNKELVENDAPVSLIAAMLPVQFKIKKTQMLDYAYKHDNPVKTLKDLAEKEVTRYFASSDMLKLMSTGRSTAIVKIREAIQRASDKIQLGVEIVAVALVDAHPPIDDNKLPEAFQDVVGAQEEKEAEILSAKAYRAKIIPKAEADALQLVLQAEAYKNEKTKVSKAEIKRFRQRLIGYRAMPEMYLLNTKLEFLETDCRDVRKFIVPATAQYDVYVINLEEKQRLDLLDISDLQEEVKHKGQTNE
jgi:regulator of protease activity HflC (stomatin/prohibitin superfamily)